MAKIDFTTLQAEVLNSINTASTLEALNEVRNAYLSKKGKVSLLLGEIRNIASEDKKAYGEAVNALRDELTLAFLLRQQGLEEKALNAKLLAETIDITLPGSQEEWGFKNPFWIIKDEIEQIFIEMGYKVSEGPEVETDEFNFTLLNIPKDHPARDMQDSFYIDANRLMRTHTSPVQARVMQSQSKLNETIKIICPGKVYRRDDDDMTHSHQFGQVEGLLVGRNINVGHLHATLDLFIKKMFGEERKTRLRSSYFPFTEPSVEVDVSCHECQGKGCSTCKGTGWIEILGGGMVNPNVLSMNGFDPETFTGFAFGIGIERVAMLRYKIDDIRRIYQNDIRFLKQFSRK
ncbi:MAG TPA: phenylalanine--tRNA ligase subunit alpha [Bacilli bacterium]|nr:phenylalanine--tRNA ligase subunit alpha [Bacilli bacterium]